MRNIQFYNIVVNEKSLKTNHFFFHQLEIDVVAVRKTMPVKSAMDAVLKGLHDVKVIRWNHHCSWGDQCSWLSWLAHAHEYTSPRPYIQAFV